MSSMKIIGSGRLQLRHSGKHLLLTKGRKCKATKFKADSLIDSKVVVYAEVISDKKIVRRRSSPRF